MPGRRAPRVLRRAKTAVSLPARVVACEDRCAALEAHVVTRIDEMRSELAELRALLTTQLDADADATELLGRLLRSSEARLERLEGALTRDDVAPALGQGPGERPAR